MRTMNIKHITDVDVINYISIEVLENKGIIEPTEQQIQTVERRIKSALKRGDKLNLKAHLRSIRGESEGKMEESIINFDDDINLEEVKELMALAKINKKNIQVIKHGA